MISVEPVGHVALLRLDRPSKRNALTPTMLADLRGCIDRATSARALVLSATGETFCAGFDLSLCRDDDTVLERLLRGLADVIVALRTLPCPVVVSAHGAAIAGGCAILGGADIVLTTHDAKLGYPVVRLGISPAVSAPFLAALVQHGPARARLLDTSLISGRQAVAIGLAHESLPDAASCEKRALDLASALAEKPPHALVMTKRLLNTLDQTLDHAAAARDVSLALVGSDEQQSLLPAVWSAKPNP